MKSENLFVKSCAVLTCVLYASLVACSSADSDLARFIEDTKKEPGGRVDTLKMVGTLKLSGRMFGLVQTKDGLVHRIVPGDYMGQADGKVTDVTASKISLIEIVPDGLGGYMERRASLGLNE